MKLLSWRVGVTWAQWHIAHFGRPLCGTPVPDRVQQWAEDNATPRRMAHTCLKCRELALAQSEKPADRGEAIDGPNGLTGAAGPVDREAITAGQERVAT